MGIKRPSEVELTPVSDKQAPTILIIDDDADLCGAYQTYLEGKGYQVQVANEGMAGWSMAKDNPPDLLVCDHLLPRIFGSSIIGLFRSQLEDKTIPIIALSGFGFPDEMEIFEPITILKKPILPSQLAQTIETMLANRSKSV